MEWPGRAFCRICCLDGVADTPWSSKRPPGGRLAVSSSEPERAVT